MSTGWIGVDFDGTLAEYDRWAGGAVLGQPVPAMLDRVKVWRAAGIEVRIVTARAGRSNTPNFEGVADDDAFADAQIALIQAWCVEHLGEALPVTASKDFSMIELWDDRAVAVETNTGRVICAASRVNPPTP